MALRANRYFQDYEVETTLCNGVQRRRYVYKGDRYDRILSPEARAKERVAYLLLAIPAGALLVAAMLQPVAANFTGIFAALSLLALIPAFCTAEGAVEAFFRKGTLKKGNYQERLVMLRVMPILGAALELILAAGYLYGIAQKQAVPASLAAVLCVVGAAACHAAIARRELRVSYRVIPGPRSMGADPAAEPTTRE